MKKTFLTFGLLLLSLSVIAQKTITSAEIGLVGDGKTLNTTAIQATIDRLSQEGGDEVWIGEKFQSNPEIAGSPRNSFRTSLVLVSWR